MLPYVVMYAQAHHMIYCHLIYTLTHIWNVHRSKQSSISTLSLHLTCLSVLSFIAHQHVLEIFHVLLLLHPMIYLLNQHKAMRLPMMKIVSTHKTLPTHHHLVCCMKTTCQVILLKILMKPATEMAVIMKEVLKSVRTTILKLCMIWFTSQNKKFSILESSEMCRGVEAL